MVDYDTFTFLFARVCSIYPMPDKSALYTAVVCFDLLPLGCEKVNPCYV